MAAEFPRIGVGTYGHAAHDQCVESVRTALEVGYRHVDTAQSYDNEDAVGEAIAGSPVDREDVFLATKVDTDDLAYEDVLETTAASLDRLGVDAVDLLYVHWPIDTYGPEGTLAAFDELVDPGSVRHVGLSNFTPGLLRDAIDRLDAPLFGHQVECHPLRPQDELLALAEEHGHHLVAYSPLAQAEILDHPVLAEVAEDVGASPAQVSLAWLRQRGVHPIPKATSREHVEDNYGSLRLDLGDDAVARIDAIEDRKRVIDFDGAPWNRA